MKPSRRIQKVIVFVATLLLLGGLSGAQEPNPKGLGRCCRRVTNARLSRPGGDWAIQGSEVQS